MQDTDSIMADLVEIDGQPMTTSPKVAARFGKRHDNVTASIEKLLKAFPEYLLNFKEVSESYKNGKGGTQTRTTYQMTKDGFTLLAMGFTGRKALEWKAGYIKAFNQMAAKIAQNSRVPAVPVTLHERIVAWEQLDSATYAAAKGGSADMNKRKRALKVLRPEAVLIAEEQQPDMFAIKE